MKNQARERTEEAEGPGVRLDGERESVGFEEFVFFFFTSYFLIFLLVI